MNIRTDYVIAGFFLLVILGGVYGFWWIRTEEKREL